MATKWEPPTPIGTEDTSATATTEQDALANEAAWKTSVYAAAANPAEAAWRTSMRTAPSPVATLADITAQVAPTPTGAPAAADSLMPSMVGTVQDMLDMNWTQGLTTATREAQTEKTRQIRGQTGQIIGNQGLMGQGAGIQAAAGAEQAAAQGLSAAELQIGLTEQEARERGVDLGIRLNNLELDQESAADTEFWKEFNALIETDPESAAAMFTEKTGEPMDVTDVALLRNMGVAGAVSNNIAKIVGQYASNPTDESYQLGLKAASPWIREELLRRPGMSADQVTDEAIEAEYRNLWNTDTLTDSAVMLNQLKLDPAFDQYFDTEAEAEVATKWLSRLATDGGLVTDPETGAVTLKDGTILPWDDPATMYLFKDWEGNDHPADYDLATDMVTITTPNGETKPVSQLVVQDAFRGFIDELEGSGDGIVVTSKVREGWYDAYKNGTTADYVKGLHQEAQQGGLTAMIDANETDTGGLGHGLSFGEGVLATIPDDILDELPTIRAAFNDGTFWEEHSDICDGSFGQERWTGDALTRARGMHSAARSIAANAPFDSQLASDPSVEWVNDNDPVAGWWESAGVGEGGSDRRTVLAEKAKSYINQHLGDVVDYYGDPYVIMGYTDDTGKRGNIQNIILFDIQSGDTVYLGSDTMAGSKQLYNELPFNVPGFMSESHQGASYPLPEQQTKTRVPYVNGAAVDQ